MSEEEEDECKRRFIVKATNEETYDEVAKHLEGMPETDWIDTYMKKRTLSMLWVDKVPALDHVLVKLKEQGKIREYYNDAIIGHI
jgi:hypothetical protein